MTRISRPQETFSVECAAILRESAAAICVRLQIVGAKPGHFEEMWFPLSQTFEIHRGDPPRLVVSAWIAKQKGLI